MTSLLVFKLHLFLESTVNDFELSFEYGGIVMEQLKQRILQESAIISKDILRLDSIINQQVDPSLIMDMGKELASRFVDEGITKVLTIESSGIPAAFATALQLNVPLVFARRKQTVINDPNSYLERVPSFTKGMVSDLVISKQFLSETDRILFIDDIIANGDGARGIVKIIERSGAQLIGMGIVVEKSFQAGADYFREQGVRVESLVKIASLNSGEVIFKD